MRNRIARAGAATVLTLLLLCLLPVPTQASGVAVSPVSIEVADAFRGNEYRRTITIGNPAINEARDMSLEAGGEIEDWVTFHDPDDPETAIDSINVPGRPGPTAPAGTARVLVRFRLPDDVATRLYSGSLYVKTVPTGDGGAAVRVPVPVSIEVTGTQILRGTVERVEARWTEIGLPLVIKVTFANTGNVIAQPVIDVAITGDGRTVAAFGYSETEVKVDDRQIIEVEWDTEGSKAGDYTAQVAVSLAGESIDTRNVPVRILPRGGLAAQGTLVDLTYDRPPTLDTLARFDATFKNTGIVDADAKLIAEVYRDGMLIEQLESEKSQVSAGDEDVISAYFRPQQPGDYLVRGRIHYAGKSTAWKELSFAVGGSGAANPLTFAIVGGVGLLVVGTVVVAVRKSRRRA